MKTVLLRSALLSGVLALSIAPLAHAIGAVNQPTVDKGVSYLTSLQVADGHVGNPGSDNDFSAIALSAVGKDLSTIKTAGGTSLRAYLAANLPDATTGTAADWGRTILAITADNQSPYIFGGIDSVAKLKSFASGGQLGGTTTTNEDYFGLIALVSAGLPSSDTVVANETTSIVSYQKADGGFSYTTSVSATSDVDDTAAAIVALRAAQTAGNKSPAVKTAITNAQSYIAKLKNVDGGYPSDPTFGTSSNVASTSWALIGFNALGQGNSSDAKAAQKYIRSQQLANGSFPSSFAPNTGDFFDTDPAVTALAGSTWAVNVFEPVVNDIEEVLPTPTPTPIVAPAATTPTATPAPAVTTGSVLGVTTAATQPTTPATSSVLGASTLPAVGEVSNLLLLGLAVVLAAAAGLAVRLRQIRIRNRD